MEKFKLNFSRINNRKKIAKILHLLLIHLMNRMEDRCILKFPIHLSQIHLKNSKKQKIYTKYKQK